MSKHISKPASRRFEPRPLILFELAEQLRLGTVKVKEALGPSIQVSDGEIEEALWHYYYDVGKSVTYLKSKGFLGTYLTRICGLTCRRQTCART